MALGHLPVQCKIPAREGSLCGKHMVTSGKRPVQVWKECRWKKGFFFFISSYSLSIYHGSSCMKSLSLILISGEASFR